MDKDIYVYFLLGSFENFLNKNRKEFSSLLEEESITLEDGIRILSTFKSSLSKIDHILELVSKSEDKDLVKMALAISSDNLAWLLFSLPTLYEKFPIFPEEFLVFQENIIDVIGTNLIDIENLLEKPSDVEFILINIKDNIKTISSVIETILRNLERNVLEN
jgi:hypothetical protein